jgi:hypothetical protein
MLELNVQDFPKDFEWDNDQFPPLDALTYWHFLKGAKRTIEIGCGYSTFLAYRSGVDVIAIDPKPRAKYPEISYNEQLVQEVPIEIFKSLEKDDILFVDSSHEVYQGSDVEHILFKILPKLKKGVLLQFHDYFRPDDYPDDWKTDPIMSKWNEHYYVELLSSRYDLIVNNHLTSIMANDKLIEKYPFVPKDIKRNFGAVRGSSVWLRV